MPRGVKGSGKRKRIMFDVDGVLGDFCAVALDHVFKMTGKRYHQDDITQWDIMKSLGFSDEKSKELYESMQIPGLCSSIEPYYGTEDALKAIRKFADVWCITSPFSGPYWLYERDQWLKTKLGFKSNEILHVRGESKFAVTADILVEDKTETLDQWMNHTGNQGILWERTYNRNDGWRGLSVSTWSELVRLLPTLQ